MAVPAHLSRAGLQDEIAVLERLLRGRVTAKHGTNPGDQLLEGERLGDVVVGPQVERGYLVGDVISSGEHDDGDVVDQTQAAAHLKTVRMRHGDVQQNDVGGWLSARVRPDSPSPAV